MKVIAAALSGLLFSMTWLVAGSAPTQDIEADFFVSTDGSDAWSGTTAAVSAQRTDGPFATLERARDAVRKLRDRGSKDIVVYIRGGHYLLKKTVLFGLEDSGEGDSTVTYAAYPGEKPVFSSGIEIRGWRRLTTSPVGLPEASVGNVWVADVPQMNGAPRRFFTLYDSEGLLPRARSGGFTPLDPSPSEKERFERDKDTLYFPAGALKSWSNLEDVEVLIRPSQAWVVNLLPLKSVDVKRGIAETALPGTYPLGELRFLKGGNSCWVENVLEALDEPGEWVLNSQEGKLYLWPRGQSTPESIVAPSLQELIRVEGSIDKSGPVDIPVRYLRFRGLTFMHGERYEVTDNDAGLQHDWDMHDKATALIRLRGAENCAIEQCHFLHSGGGAIRVDLYGRKNRIVGNHIEHVGGTGVLLCGYGPGTKDVNSHNLVYNNHIHHTGEIYWHSPGVFVWQSGENRVANNLIHHTAYTGIIISGVMTHFFAREDDRELVRTIRWHEVGEPGGRTLEQVQPFLHTHDNLIEYNEIHHAMERLGDGNGIYVRGAGSGNVIRRNYVHHLLAPTPMQSAIRTDGGQKDTLIAENLIYKCVSQGITLKLNNRAENNIVAELIEAEHLGQRRPVSYFKLREGPMTEAVIKGNILYHSGERFSFYDEQVEISRGRREALAKNARTDYNVYYSVGNPEESRKALEKNQGEGFDAHSVAEDPLFVDPENGDFRLKGESPALKLGFIPIDVSKIGLRDTL